VIFKRGFLNLVPVVLVLVMRVECPVMLTHPSGELRKERTYTHSDYTQELKIDGKSRRSDNIPFAVAAAKTSPPHADERKSKGASILLPITP
jgi:hypothetical protein